MAEKTKDLKQGIQEFTIKQALKYLEKDPEKNAPKILDMVDKVFPKDWFKEARANIRKILDEKGNWYQLLLKICEMHPDCEFLSFTNGTLIDEEFCKEMLMIITCVHVQC